MPKKFEPLSGEPAATPPKCSFCGALYSSGIKMVAGPGGVLICADCLRKATKTLEDEKPDATH